MRTKVVIFSVGLLIMLVFQPYPVFSEREPDTSSLGDNIQQGRSYFLKYDCHACHRVAQDPSLPAPYGTITAPTLGLKLDLPKSLIEQKEAEFRNLHQIPEPDNRFEKYMLSIADPNHTIAPGYGKGSVEDEPNSDMPDYITEMTIQEMRDIIAYLMQPQNDE